jgi:hypothetical protein
LDITTIIPHKEEIASNVHDSWWDEKKKQGFHAPMACKSQDAIDLCKHLEIYKFHKFCDKCHTDMYPYNELPENIKNYDRVTVDAVLAAIKKI